MIVKILTMIAVLSVLGCVVSVFTGSAFLYILVFPILCVSVFLTLIMLSMNLFCRLLPENLNGFYAGKEARFNRIFFFLTVSLCALSWLVEEFWLTMFYKTVLIKLISFVGILLFMVLLGSSLLRRCKRKTICLVIIALALFIGLLPVVSAFVQKSHPTTEQDSTKKLKSLGYVGWVPAGNDREKAGVVKYDSTATYDGLNLYKTGDLPEALLINMDGKVVHEWKLNIKNGIKLKWHYAEMRKNGDLLAILWDRMLICMDWSSKKKWTIKIRPHHDIAEDDDGNLYVLARNDSLETWHGIPVPITGDCIITLAPDGRIIKQQDIYDLIKERITLQEIGRIYHKIIQPRKWIKLLSCKLERGFFCFGSSSVFDIMHTNSIQVIDRDIFGFCKKGDMLISILKLNLIAIVNPDKDELVWAWGTDELDAQHHPTLLENGNILIFDNGSSRGFSRVIELNPLTGRIVWQYKANPPENFFSKIRGSCQRLPSGNTLITESGKGRVFEVNKENEIVWDFHNPALNEKNQKRGAIYRMTRITDSKNFPNHIKQVFGVDTK